jgi:hypothetical protein
MIVREEHFERNFGSLFDGCLRLAASPARHVPLVARAATLITAGPMEDGDSVLACHLFHLPPCV